MTKTMNSTPLLSICVTNALPLDALKSIINQFREQKITFGLLPVGLINRGIYEIWRAPLPGETLLIPNHADRGMIISPDPPALKAFKFISVDGGDFRLTIHLNKESSSTS